MSDWTAADKLECVEREIKYRQRVYARLVAKGQMAQQQMDREVSLMQAIAADYRARAEKERLL